MNATVRLSDLKSEQEIPLEEGYNLAIYDSDEGKVYIVIDEEGQEIVRFGGDKITPVIKLPTGQHLTLNGVRIESI
jgi:hypothetical protein